MQWNQLLESISLRAPWAPEDAHKAAAATLSALGRRLPQRAVEQLARELPDELAPALRDLAPAIPSVEAIYDDVQQNESIERAQAMERAQVIVAAISPHLSAELRERLVRELPEGAGAWFEPRDLSEPPPRPGHGRTLAEGRPGGTAPLSEGAPGSRHPLSSAHPDRAHQHGVSERNPHGDTKVSSAQGLTQEREHESLAEGRSKRP